MKIALVSPYDFSVAGGVRTHIVGLEKEFRALGHEVKILAPVSDETDLPSNVIVVSDTVVPLDFSGSKARITLSLSVYRRIKRILRDERFDIVHLHEPLVPTLPVFVLRHSHAVNIGTFHAYRENDAAGAYSAASPFLRRLINRLDARIAVSQPVIDFIGRYFPGKYEVIPNGIDVARFGNENVKPIERYMDGKLNILFVGRLDKRKGFPHLLAAFPQIKEQVPDARLLVVGAFDKDDREQYVRHVRENGVRDVKFIGFVSNDDLPRYYRTAHVFCAPSTGFESFGIVLLEAMAAGTPLVASDISGYRSVITHGVDGLLTPAADEPALVQMMVLMLRDPALRERLARAGQTTAAAYSWQSIARKTLSLYERCLAAGRNRTAPAKRKGFTNTFRLRSPKKEGA